jgi:transcriptional regulator with XRE-family HTH domain
MSITFDYDLDHCFMRLMFWGRTFGLFIRELREKKGYSVEEAALLAGMETKEWLAIEAGRAPDKELLEPMADALEVDHEVIARLVVFCQDAWED